MEKYKCKKCGKEFEDWKYVKRQFCSLKCSNSHNGKCNIKTIFKKGQIAPNKGKKLSGERKLKHSENIKRLWTKGIYNKRLGYRHSELTRKKISAIQQNKSLEEWRGYTTPDLRKLRNSIEWKNWRKSVFERDNYECCCCLSNKNLHPHHIIPISIDKLQAFDITNGMTLCKECHLDKDLGLHKKM